MATKTQTPTRAGLLEVVRGLPTIPVWHATQPSAAGVLGISRDSAYRAAASGELPTLRVGGRLLVPVPQLRRALGDLTD